MARPMLCPSSMRPSSATASTLQAPRVLQFPTAATMDAGKALMELPAYGEVVEGAIDQLIGAVERHERVPFAYLRAAAQRILCGELAEPVSFRLADALSLVADPELTDAFADLFEGTRVAGDKVLFV